MHLKNLTKPIYIYIYKHIKSQCIMHYLIIIKFIPLHASLNQPFHKSKLIKKSFLIMNYLLIYN